MKHKCIILAALTVALSATVAAAPPDVNELFCYTIGPWAAPGFVQHDMPTNLNMLTWPFTVEATWARDDQNFTFDDPYDFALRVRLVDWPVLSGEISIQQIVMPNGYVSDPSRLDIISGGQSIGINPLIEVFNNGDRISMQFPLEDVVNDEFMFVVNPQVCDGDLNIDTHRNIGDVITCINGWGQYGMTDLITVINNFGDECP